MALTSANKASLRKYLGFPARFHQIQPELEQAMLVLDTVPDDEAEVLSELAKVVDLDARITDALTRLKASQVGSITLNPREIGMLRSEGRRGVRRIGQIMGVTPRSDAFAGGSVIHNEMQQG